jgi:AraC-like DNA-binding protein
MDETSAESSLCEALQSRIIPCIEREGINNFMVVGNSYRELIARQESLPDGMEVVHRPLRSRRKAMRSSRVYGATSIVNAHWPEDDLQATRTPKLCFILSGAIAYPIADYKLLCQSGHSFLIPAGIPFARVLGKESIDLHRSKNCRILQIIPYQNSLNCWISTKTLNEQGRFSNMGDVASVVGSRVSDYIKSLADELLKPGPFHEKICLGWLQLITCELYRELKKTIVVKTHGHSYRLDKTQHVDFKEEPMLQVQKYIRKNLALGISINDAANYACLSRSVFTKKFREYTGTSFSTYTTQLRLQEAQLLLIQTDLSIIQVSKTVGLTTARLRAMFQKEFSLSPTQYRERHRESLSPK